MPRTINVFHHTVQLVFVVVHLISTSRVVHVLTVSIEYKLTLNAPIATKVVCFSRLLKCSRSLYGKSVDPDQTAPIGAVCSGYTLFASILTSSVM